MEPCNLTDSEPRWDVIIEFTHNELITAIKYAQVGPELPYPGKNIIISGIPELSDTIVTAIHAGESAVISPPPPPPPPQGISGTEDIEVRYDVSWVDTMYYWVLVSVYNKQQDRRVSSPGWGLSWMWQQNEIVWEVKGAQATDAGNCIESALADVYGPDIQTAHTCRKKPTFVDLPLQSYSQESYPEPAVFNLQLSCCKNGTLGMPSFPSGDPAFFTVKGNSSVAQFRMRVGRAKAKKGYENVVPPRNMSVGLPGFTCGGAEKLQPSVFQAETRLQYHRGATSEGFVAKLTIANRENTSIPEWFAVVRMPALDNVSAVYSFNNATISCDSALFWGHEYSNNWLLRTAPNAKFLGNVQSVIKFGAGMFFNYSSKDVRSLFPSEVVVNGQACSVPDVVPTFPPVTKSKLLISSKYLALILGFALCGVLAYSVALF
ncbi:unnamed protein product [Closterium sp. NIES-53]